MSCCVLFSSRILQHLWFMSNAPPKFLVMLLFYLFIFCYFSWILGKRRYNIMCAFSHYLPLEVHVIISAASVHPLDGCPWWRPLRLLSVALILYRDATNIPVCIFLAHFCNDFHSIPREGIPESKYTCILRALHYGLCFLPSLSGGSTFFSTVSILSGSRSPIW